MKISNAEPGDRGIMITWRNERGDQSTTGFPYVFLRDNDPEELHPQTRERVFDLTSVNLPIRPDSHAVSDDALRVIWPGKDSPSTYSSAWLQQYVPGRPRADASMVERVAWDGQSLGEIPRSNAPHCASNPIALRDALLALKRHGILLLDSLQDSLDASQAFGDHIGFRRRTNFGDMFEVINMPDPNNLAYTALPLPLHTDLPNQEIVPGYQLLHCYRNDATGGESIFADGLKICEDLRSEAPEDFELLRSVKVPWRFHDDANDIRSHRPILTLRQDGSLDYLVFNAHIADVPDLEADLLDDFYLAYQRFMQRIRDPQYAISQALQPGEMVIFDNSRVLHSRAAFDPNSGERHLCGYYIERNEVDSRIRVLDRLDAS